MRAFLPSIVLLSGLSIKILIEEDAYELRESGINGYNMGLDFSSFQPKAKIKYGFDVHGFATYYTSYNSVNSKIGIVGTTGGGKTTMVDILLGLLTPSKGKIFVDDKIITPLICYESIYGDLQQKGETNLIAIITNDGWWKNTVGYKQHFAYARLRAIEQRKTIIRSANTGISGAINAKGEVLESTNWEEAICVSAEVSLNNETTFYSMFGDYIGRLSVFVATMLFIVAFVKGRLKK